MATKWATGDALRGDCAPLGFNIAWLLRVFERRSPRAASFVVSWWAMLIGAHRNRKVEGWPRRFTNRHRAARTGRVIMPSRKMAIPQGQPSGTRLRAVKTVCNRFLLVGGEYS